jgi:hypothetical protein
MKTDFSKPLGRAFGIVLAVFVAGCTAGPGLRPDSGSPTGYVVASIGLRLTGPAAGKTDVARITFRNKATGSWGAIEYDERLLTASRIAHEDASAKVTMVAIPVHPGSYELEAVSFQYPGGTVWRSKDRFSVPFQVAAGESIYLGEFLAHSQPVERWLGTEYARGYFSRANRAQRDIPLIRAAFPETARTTVREADASLGHPPFIVGTRAPAAR